MSRLSSRPEAGGGSGRKIGSGRLLTAEAVMRGVLPNGGTSPGEPATRGNVRSVR